ncbi:MAG: hypothetical protein ACFCBW_14105 [Candidatus Competibacterales bacterium]
MARHVLTFVSTALMGALLAFSASAQVDDGAIAPLAEPVNAIKCIHTDGRIEYRELDDPDADCERLRTRVPTRLTNDPGAETQRVREQAQQSESRQAQAEAQAAQNQAYAESCRRAQENLRALSSGLSLTRADSQGNQVPIGADEIPALRQQVQREVDFFCN